MGSAVSSPHGKSGRPPPEPASLPLATTKQCGPHGQPVIDDTIPVTPSSPQVMPLWLCTDVLDATDESAVYTGENSILNDGILGYDQLTLDRATAGDQTARMLVVAADFAANAFRRDAPLVMTEEQLEAIAPKRTASAPDCCCICQEAYLSGELRRRLPCGHEFHAECIKEWVTANVGSCPTCRQRLQPSLSELEKRAGSEAFIDAEALAIAEFNLSLNPVAEEGEEGEAPVPDQCSASKDELV